MPSYSNSNTVNPLLLLKRWWFLGALAMGMCLVLKPILAVFGFLAILIFFCLFLFPHVIIPFLLIIRSSLDIFTDIGFYIGPMLINIPSITSLFLFFGGGLYLLFNMAVRKEMILDRMGKVFFFWLVALLFWVITAYINFGIDGLIALREWIRLASLFMIYVLVYYLTVRIGYKRVINYMFWALPIPLIVGIYQILTKSVLQVQGINRIYGTLAHPNVLALFLVLFIGLTVWKIRFGKMRLFWLMLLVAQIFALINTFSIGGIVMFLVMSTILILKTLKIRNRLLIFILIFVVLAVFSLSEHGKQRLEEIQRTGDVVKIMETGRMFGEGSMAWRALNWHLFIKEWKDKPLLGYGLSTTGELVSPMKNIPHNDYLRFLVETGLVGLLLFLFVLLTLGKEIWRLYLTSFAQSAEFSYLVLIGFSIYAAWVVGSFADNFITATGFQYYFWALLGVLMAKK